MLGLERFAKCSSATAIMGNVFRRNFKPHSHVRSHLLTHKYFDRN